MEETTGEQLENSKVPKQLQPFMYKKGQSGNPKGRPEGISMKEYVRMKFRHMSDEEREEYLEGIDKKTIWEMAEDKAKQAVDGNIQGTINVVVPKAVAEAFNIHESTPETGTSN